MIPESISRKAAEFTNIHSLPQVLTAILKEIDDERSIDSLARLISRDIALTAKMLRMANSAFYRRRNEVGTIAECISVMGTRAVKALALSVTIFDITKGSELSGLIDLRDFWRHNLEVAVIGGDLASKFAADRSEEVFACGLLHDLGILFFLEMFPEDYVRVLRDSAPGNLLPKEEEIFGANHCQVGAFIARNWQLPETFAESMEYHHSCDIGRDSPARLEIWNFVNAAHRLAGNWIDCPDPQSAADVLIKESVLISLGMTSPDSGFVGESKNRALAMAGFLDIDIGDPWTLLNKINRELSEIYTAYEKLIIENDNLKTRLETLSPSTLIAGHCSAFQVIKDLLDNLKGTIRDSIASLDKFVDDSILHRQFALILGRLESITSGIAEICVREQAVSKIPQNAALVDSRREKVIKE